MPSVTEYTGAMTQAGRPISGRSFVLPEHKVMYVSVAKNACTSIKWLLAELAGEDMDAFLRSDGMSSTRADTIHQRHLWQHVAKYDGATPYEGRVHPDDGWFVFGVLRNPFDRLFSGWQSKFLNHDPHYRRFVDEPFYPDLPTSVDDVVRSFGDFVRFLADNPEHKVATTDTHFASQVALLQPSRVPYTRLYDVKELKDLLADLSAHLDRVGVEHGPLELARDNGTPLRSCQALFADGIGDLVAERYAPDLELRDWSLDDLPADPPTWDAEVFRGVAATAGAYDRIHDLTRQLRSARKRTLKLKSRLEARNRDARQRDDQQATQAPEPAAGGRAAKIVRRVVGR